MTYYNGNRVHCEVCGEHGEHLRVSPGRDGEDTCEKCWKTIAECIAKGMDFDAARDVAAGRED